ncbi:MAG TPA: VCBS repeat-containing protein, partial [Candidatus Atribacteria bacterium]|nr:VCBS repeat-containing protein [Candidatus Atribacteria bacterium]
MSIIRVAITLGLVTYIFSFTQLLYGKFKEWKVYNYNFPSATDKNFYISIECCDIDMDGDFDLFVGNWKGFIAFYENIGNPDKFLFKLVNNGLSKESSFYKVFVGNKAIPRLVDIDADNDFDLFVGNNNGNIAFYRNDGDMNHPLFKLIREGTEQINSYFNINVGFAAAPFFVDIDNDNDYDLFIGNAQGYIAFYRNDGTSTSPLFTRVKGGFSIQDSFENINTEGYSIPVFCDINNDGKYDLFVGNWDGTIYYYKNIGSEKLPKYK